MMMTSILSLFKREQKHKKIKRLTTELIDSIADDDLLEMVFDNLSLQLPKNHHKEYHHITTKFNISQRSIYLSWWLEAEVNNGGFNQYYVNSTKQYVDMVPELLQLMGANKFAELTNRANKVYKSNQDQITKEQDGTIDGFSRSYQNNPLNVLDDEFYNLYEKENLYQIQVDYIRKNKHDFVR